MPLDDTPSELNSFQPAVCIEAIRRKKREIQWDNE